MSERAVRAPTIEDFEEVKQRSLWLDAFERLVRNKTAVFGMIVVGFILFLAVFGSVLAPKDYLETFMRSGSKPHDGPSSEYWLGTDKVGRDILSRLMHGARTAVFAAAITVILGQAIGITMGAVAGYFRGVVDDIIMRIVDVLFSFPDFLFAAFLSASIRTPIVKLMGDLKQQTDWGILDETIFIDYIILFGALAMVNWSGTARLIRGQILSLREQDFIRAEIALGIPTWLIIRKHLIPNSIAPLVVGISGGIGGILLLESSLSFFGLGIQPPAASWGDMINTALPQWRLYPWEVLMPGLLLGTAVFGFNYLGDGLNDALNPRQIRR
jgi:ABC-type dipeptide/oligopeptide/nickel transport system permease subunit